MEGNKPSGQILDLNVVSQKGRCGDGGTYLVVADDSEEFKVALRYGCAMAKQHRAHVGILYVIGDQDFQHWGAVESRIKKELRQEAERYVWNVAKTAHEFNGMVPSLYFAEGDRAEAVVSTINEHDDIIQLILGGGSSGEAGPGPILSYFLGKGMSRLGVPLVVVPGHLQEFS